MTTASYVVRIDQHLSQTSVENRSKIGRKLMENRTLSSESSGMSTVSLILSTFKIHHFEYETHQFSVILVSF